MWVSFTYLSMFGLVNQNNMIDDVLISYGLSLIGSKIVPYGSGLINHTYKLTANNQNYILQEINTNIFKAPYHIVNNLALIEKYINETAPGYLFVAPLKSLNGDFIVKAATGEHYRLFPFVQGSHSVDVLKNEKEAYEAAKQFGKFTCLLKDFDISLLEYPLQNFHDLPLRFDQFKIAVKNAEATKQEEAAAEINEVYKHQHILETYNQLISGQEIPMRVVHHDTKISNILFDDEQNALCLVDLDTVMPGYYLSDVGDMMRTYLSPASEEEMDLNEIRIREDFFRAIYTGYLSEMGTILTETEKEHFIFSGKMMIYMQALRFLTDFLNNDIYYGARYPGHNLIRAKNQFKLLNEYVNAEPAFNQLIDEVNQGNHSIAEHRYNQTQPSA